MSEPTLAPIAQKLDQLQRGVDEIKADVAKLKRRVDRTDRWRDELEDGCRELLTNDTHRNQA